MSRGDVRPSIRGLSLVALCACAIVLRPALSKAARTEATAAPWSSQDTVATDRPDTVRVDTARVIEREPVWRMDELKGVLVGETGDLKPGMKYRERKNGRVAMACALVVPGLGQVYNEKPFKAAIVMGVETVYFSQIFMNRRHWAREKVVRDAFAVNSRAWIYHDRWVTEYMERSIDWIWWSSAVVLVAVIDAYVDAHLDDMRFRVEPRAAADGVGVSLVYRY